jgi:hypothetical protein
MNQTALPVRIALAPALNCWAAVVERIHVYARLRGCKGGIFVSPRPWQLHAALVALYRFRPDLGGSDPQAHAVHMLAGPRDYLYFAHVGRPLKLYGVGAQWGNG